MLDYLQEPYITENTERKIKISLSNEAGRKDTYRISVAGLPEKWTLSGLPADTVGVEKGGKKILELSLMAVGEKPDTARMNLILSRGIDRDTVPFTLIKKSKVR